MRQTTLNFGGRVARGRSRSPGGSSSTALAVAPPSKKARAEADTAAPGAPVPGSDLASLIESPEWRQFLAPFTSPAWRGGLFGKIESFLEAERRAGKHILPPRPLIFSAFNSTPFAALKVVLVGQDPYPTPGVAHGLSFSVLPGTRQPQSLRNMFEELARDVPGVTPPRAHGYLQAWAAQGMLMLNATLTVEASAPNSHAKCGWQSFTDDVIRELSRRHPNRLVFLLWGGFAGKKRGLIDESRHVVVANAHPSPLSVKLWRGCGCFSKCNAALERIGHTPMDWQLPETVALPEE